MSSFSIMNVLDSLAWVSAMSLWWTYSSQIMEWLANTLKRRSK